MRLPTFGVPEPDPELRGRVEAAERAAEAAAAREQTIDRKIDVYVRVMKAHGLTVKDLGVLRRKLQG